MLNPFKHQAGRWKPPNKLGNQYPEFILSRNWHRGHGNQVSSWCLLGMFFIMMHLMSVVRHPSVVESRPTITKLGHQEHSDLEKHEKRLNYSTEGYQTFAHAICGV